LFERLLADYFRNEAVHLGTPSPTSGAVCTENPIGVDDVTESPKLGE
jgi:hypothetical protein